MSIDIKLAIENRKSLKPRAKIQNIYCPGDDISTDNRLMRGHGTHCIDGRIISSVAGICERVNKLVTVRPLKTRYAGEIGDLVIGRILEVQQKRWKVDTNSRMDSVLQLTSVMLPSGETRKKTVEDEFMMRSFLKEGDLISAEVHNIFNDGAISLYSRSDKYGKLENGTLVKVSPTIIKRCKSHFHILPCNVNAIIGLNGYIWLSPLPVEDGDMETIIRDKATIARLRNCILALAEHCVQIYDTSIMAIFEASLKYKVEVDDCFYRKHCSLSNQDATKIRDKKQQQQNPWRHGCHSCETIHSTLYTSSLDYTVLWNIAMSAPLPGIL
ncbi:EXOSC2 [Cordylochernes scorpioides]|uniref:EXOSC2 n=1 Tax=Cordylochernes scorpioides TaxID=51811 RepID=A0ABY6KPP1_9ARAC|nr:EXOSC2 [Cordylochernes scorpioides]